MSVMVEWNRNDTHVSDRQSCPMSPQTLHVTVVQRNDLRRATIYLQVGSHGVVGDGGDNTELPLQTCTYVCNYNECGEGGRGSLV